MAFSSGFSLKLMPVTVTSLSTWAPIMQQTLMLSVYCDASYWSSAFVLTGGQSPAVFAVTLKCKTERVCGGPNWYIASVGPLSVQFMSHFTWALASPTCYLIIVLCHNYAEIPPATSRQSRLTIFQLFVSILVVECGCWPVNILYLPQKTTPLEFCSTMCFWLTNCCRPVR